MTRNLKLIVLTGTFAATGLAFVYSAIGRSLRAADENVDWPALSLLAQTRGYGPALRLVDSRLASHPRDALMYYFRARLYYGQGDGKKALSEADKAIELGYAQEISHLLKGLIYGRLFGDYRREKELSSRALGFDPAYSDAYAVRAEAEYALGEYKACAADSDSFSRMSPAATDGYEYALLCRQALYDYAGAEEAGLKILELKPAAHAVFWRLGLLYEQEGLRKKAIKSFSEAIRLNGNRPQYYLDRARVCEEEGDFFCSARDYYSAMNWKEVSGYASYYYLLGSSMHRVGELKLGLQAADRAVGMQPLFAGNYDLRGRLRADSGDLPGAKADFLKMSAIDPALSEESLRLRRLLGKQRVPDKL